MTRMRGRVLLVVLAGLVVTAAGLAGYVLAKSKGPSEAEVTTARLEAQTVATERAAPEAADKARVHGTRQGRTEGRRQGEGTGRRTGSKKGRSAAVAAAEEIRQQELAAEQVAAANEPPFPPPGSVYTDELPSGQPGYVLPEEQRSLSCVGVDAETGECVGD